jgi:iron complex transport system permease protein
MKISIPKQFWILAFFLAFVLLPFFGGETISLNSLWNKNGIYEIDHRIFWDLRIPRLLLVVGVGGSLAMLGATYQIVFNNPLAEPYILGISSAVTLGVVVGETLLNLPAHSTGNFLVGSTFSIGVVALLILSYQWKTGRELERIVLFGLGLNFILSSALFLLLSYNSQSQGGGALRWLFGNIPWVNLQESVLFLAFVVPLCGILWALGRQLDALSLGDTVAKTLGVSPSKIRILILFITSLHLTVITSTTGSIGFLGLVVPHCIRLLFRPSSTRWLFIGSFFGGALFLGISDSLSRVLLPPMEFPVGIITTLLGGPLFLYLLWKK